MKNPKKSTHKNNLNQGNQNTQDFGNQSSIIQDEQYKNNMNLTNASLHLEDIDQKWMELKIVGKNISRRSYHTSVIHDGVMYIYGGYDVNSGILDDFWSINVDEPEHYKILNMNPQYKKQDQDFMEKQIKLEDIIENYPGPRERHQATVIDGKMYLFGGLKTTLESTNEMYSYEFETQKWEKIQYEGDVKPLPIDSHSMTLDHDNKKILFFGGFFNDSEKGGYTNDIYSFDIQSNQWQILTQNQEKAPKPRAGASICYLNNKIFMFGGTNVSKKFADFWEFDIVSRQWTQVEQNQLQPESRNGHSLIVFEGQILLFGGIHDITHEKNDLMIINPETKQWKVVDSDTSHAKEEGSITPRDQKFEELDTIKKVSQTQRKLTRRTFNKQPDVYNKANVQPVKRQYQTMKFKDEFRTTQNDMEHNFNGQNNNSQYNDEGSVLGGVNQMEENKKRRQELKKVALLNEFKLSSNEQDQEEYKNNSPTTIAMKNSIISVGNPEGKKKYDLKQTSKAVTYNKPFDFTSNKIIGKAPSARDGQSAVVFENYCIIFGGDRHLMAYNDFFQMDLEMATGIKMKDKPVKNKKILKDIEQEQGKQNEQQQSGQQQGQQQQQLNDQQQDQEQQNTTQNNDQQNIEANQINTTNE